MTVVGEVLSRRPQQHMEATAIALVLLAVSLGLLLMAVVSFVLHRRDWRAKLAEAEAAESK